MTEDELKAIEATPWIDKGPAAALIAEVRRLRAEQEVLKTLAKACRSFWSRHPGDHVVRQGISTQGEALLRRIESLK